MKLFPSNPTIPICSSIIYQSNQFANGFFSAGMRILEPIQAADRTGFCMEFSITNRYVGFNQQNELFGFANSLPDWASSLTERSSSPSAIFP